MLFVFLAKGCIDVFEIIEFSCPKFLINFSCDDSIYCVFGSGLTSLIEFVLKL